MFRLLQGVVACAAFCLFLAVPASAASLPEAQEHSFVLKNFTFHTGESLPELTVHYRTLGNPKGSPVLVLHGTTASGAQMLRPGFAGALFGPGRPLDATKHYLIFPDSLGTGKTAKPSDGLRAKFPRYNYDDMVLAQYRLLTEGLGVKHLRAVVGFSMGGMHAWVWAVNYPDFMDAIVPLAAQPTEMASRNWMLRRMVTDAVRNDPDWKDGNYTTQPQHFRLVHVYFNIATNGGSMAYQAKAPTREKADELLAKMLGNQTKMDANDYLYQWEASRDYNPSPKLDRVKARVLAVNSADDERNPPESGLMEKELKRLKNASYYLIPASAETSGHATVMIAKLWAPQLEQFLKSLPNKKK